MEDGQFDTNEQARDFLSRWILYKEDFSRELQIEEFPIMRVMRHKTGFEGYKVGMYSAKDGRPIILDCSGEPMLDSKGEFIGGLILFYDVTGMLRGDERHW
jgi:hypothetical protein